MLFLVPCFDVDGIECLDTGGFWTSSRRQDSGGGGDRKTDQDRIGLGWVGRTGESCFSPPAYWLRHAGVR